MKRPAAYLVLTAGTLMTDIELSSLQCRDLVKWMDYMGSAAQKTINFVDTNIFKDNDCSEIKELWDELIAELYPEGIKNGFFG